MKQTDVYLEKFEGLERDASQPGWVFPLRKAGLARFSALGFPTTQQEDWRYTNVAPIARLPFRPLTKPTPAEVEEFVLQRFVFSGLDCFRLVFVDGHWHPGLSRLEGVPAGATVGSLAQGLATMGGALETQLNRLVGTQENAFSALNTAFFQDGALVRVPAGVALPKPVHALFISTARENGGSTHPRNLVVAEANSQVTVLESYVSLADGAYFTNAVTEVIGGENATIEHVKFQDESVEAFHVAAIHSHLSRGCNFAAHSISTGSRIARNNIRTSLDGEGVESILNGLYLTRGEQVADHHMVVEHAQPHCNSHEYYNGILDGKSKGVFHGRILVRQIAQKTDAKQTNKNLLLSDDATADTKPQLEIYADDVKCTHGATVGQLNEESIFYLRARGIGEDTARRMLIHAFAGEIIERIRHTAVREELDKLVWDRLEANPQIASHV
jgi:Fe-S cluster assembly protein SufD